MWLIKQMAKKDFSQWNLKVRSRKCRPQNCSLAASVRRRQARDVEQADYICLDGGTLGSSTRLHSVLLDVGYWIWKVLLRIIASSPHLFPSHASKLLFISVSLTGLRWQSCTSLSYKVETTCLNAEPRTERNNRHILIHQQYVRL